MKKILFAASMWTASAFAADCNNDECLAPAEQGIAVQTSHVLVREVATTSPSAEYRRADEVVVIAAPLSALEPEPALEPEAQLEAPPQQIETREVPVFAARPDPEPITYPSFVSGNNLLSDAERAALSALAERLADKLNLHLRIIGYADVQPLAPGAVARFGTNQGLSEARAAEVAVFLKTLPDFGDAVIETRGRGDTQPVVSCDAKLAQGKRVNLAAYQNCLAPNRRVEIEIWYDQPIGTKTETTILPPEPQRLPVAAFEPVAPVVVACKDQVGGDVGLPFRVSVDGEPLDLSDTPNSADTTRCSDLALEQADIQVRFDGLETTPILNLTAAPDGAVRGESVRFTPYSNYTAFIAQAEIRVFAAGDSTQKTPLEIIALDAHLDTAASWTVPQDLHMDSVQYLLRVTDQQGRFDETTPKILRLIDTKRLLGDEQKAAHEDLIGYGENHRGLANIPVKGGAVTVNGSQLAPGSTVSVFERDVPVDATGKFAVRQILPPGDHLVNIATLSADGQRAEFSRHLLIPLDDWFYIALADLTVGKNNVSGPAKLVTGNDTNRYDEKIYADGRLAFYLKGKIKGEYLLTASADTREQPLENLFSNFNSKDPRYLLRRLDPNAYYPVYGDDSTLVEDAPTQGKFYVKLERGDSEVMWGSFKTTLTGTDLVNYSRALYGARAKYVSPEATTFGERRTDVEAFAADPGTLAAVEEFRGTGGSLYFLRNQDILVGSDRLRVEVRDRDSGIVLKSTTLVASQDYEINAIQGRVVLRTLLSSTADANTLVQTGSLSGQPVFLVAGYEYTPGVSSIDNLTKGGRASYWVNDQVKVGVTGYQQDGSGAEQRIIGGDVTLRKSAGTYLKLETALSKGPGSGALSSQNGGFNFGGVPQTRTNSIDASAQRVEGALELSEFGSAGTLSGYVLKRGDGYSAPGQLSSEGVDQYGAQIKLPVNERLDILARADHKDGSISGLAQSAEVDARYALSAQWKASAGLRFEDRSTPLAAGASAILAETGARTDLATTLAYHPEGETGPWEIYGLAQTTLAHDSSRRENNRGGLGGHYQLNDRVKLNGEISDGDGGVGSKIGADYRVSDRSSVYLNYSLDSDRSDTGYRGRVGSLTSGVKSRYTDSVSVYAEERYQTADNGPSGLIHAFGLDFAANDRWTYGAKLETGTTADPATGDLKRNAVSLSTGYLFEKTKYAGVLEYRTEQGNVTGERRTWLTKNTLAWQTTADWRALTRLNLARSSANTAATVSGDYTEVVFGMGYRPVSNDRLNVLFKYTYLADEPSPGQLGASGVASTFEQRDHVLSVDGICDLVPKLSLGAKLGYRLGEIRDTSIAGSPSFDSRAWLGVLRTDWHVVHEWDAIGELRYLNVAAASDSRSGALVGVYRHVNENIKIGGGYNFTDFSDDLTQLSYKSRGWFVNLLGEF